jgi:hypothetical protein
MLYVDLLQNRDTRSLNRAVYSCLSLLRRIYLVPVLVVVLVAILIVFVIVVVIVVVSVQGVVPSKDPDVDIGSEGI